MPENPTASTEASTDEGGQEECVRESEVDLLGGMKWAVAGGYFCQAGSERAQFKFGVCLMGSDDR